MTEKDTLTILGVLTAAYPNARITPETVRVYVLTLQDIPLDLLENAALHLITTSTFFPTVAELRDASYRIMFGLHRVPTAAEAWNQIQRQRYQCLAYFIYNVQSEKPSFSHPFVEQVIHAFGCRNLTDPTSEPYMRANFCKTYDTLLDRTLTDLKTLPVVRAFTNQNQTTESRCAQLKPEWGQPESMRAQHALDHALHEGAEPHPGYALRKSEERPLDHAEHMNAPRPTRHALRKSEERPLDHALHTRPEPTSRQDLLPE
ncbi:MAG TPA: replicative helicase loader/inhibitor [Anaerolineaceae bacterium]|jgi:hypothetical protein|nr:replicative helicase loader/inhibitor [Anaerolineaceae bacterium]HQK04133.1 replicative helicase loader/inhibitor [Anaerolineaceae bacterium]